MITEVSKIEYYLVITDEQEWNRYRRNVNSSSESWEREMGDSWECCSGDWIEIEFKNWQAMNSNLIGNTQL
jgi:hypothetical protein